MAAIEKLGTVGRKHRKSAALILDLCVSMLASLFAVLFVRWLTSPIFDFQHYVLVWVFLAAVFSLLGILLLGTNHIVIKHSTLRSVGLLALTTLVKEICFSACILIGIFHFGDTRGDVLMLVSDSFITLVMLVLVRVIIIAIYNDIRITPEVKVDRVPVMIYGTTDKSVAMVIRLEKSVHYDVLGYLTRDASKNGLIAQDKKAFAFADENELSRLKTELGFKSIIFANDEESQVESDKNDGLLQMSLRLGLHCLMAPKIDNMDFGGLSQEAVKSVVSTSVDYIPDGMTSFERNVKRFADFMLATILLVVFSPLFLICYIALKLGDGGPAIYKQERIGRFGRPFMIYKFRSMRTDAESSGPALYSGDDDPRLTKVGRFLRIHHLDELPQLWNVWKGEMAFVGYRPERKFYIDQIMELDPRYYFLYQIRPGVTSYSTLKNGYTDTMDKMLRRLEFDLYYLRHRSWWFDVKVLWQTFTNIVFGKVF